MKGKMPLIPISIDLVELITPKELSQALRNIEKKLEEMESITGNESGGHRDRA